MLAVALFLVVYKILFLNHLFVYVINISTSIMLWLAQLTDNPTYGFIDFITFSKSDVVFMTLTIALILIIVTHRQYKHVLVLCSIVIVWLSFSIFNTYEQKQKNEFVVFNVKQKSLVALRVGQTVYFNINDLNNNEFQRYVKPYLLTISNLKMINTTSNVFIIDTNSIFYNNRPNSVMPIIKPNYVVVSNNTPLKLTTNYKSKVLVIADCSNSYTFVKKLKKQCLALNIPFYSAKESGAFQIQL